MNTANLQLEGLLVAISALTDMLASKGLVAREEINVALDKADMAVRHDARSEELPPSNVEAMLFPIRYLKTVNARGDGEKLASFSEITTAVGSAKQRPHPGY